MKKLEEKKYRFFIILIIFLILILSLAYFFWIRKDMTDFGVCYKGGKRILLGETLYRVSDGHLQYKYSPSSALFFSFFALFPYEMAKILWYSLEFFLLFFIFSISLKILPSKEKKKGVLIGFSLLILTKFLGREIELGQVNIFIIFVLTWMIEALLEEKEIKAGALWGISLFFKPYALVFFPYFLLKKKFKLIAASIGVVLAGVAAPAIFYGFKGNLLILKEWQTSLSQSTPSLVAIYGNASLYSFLLKVFPGQNKELIILILSLIFLVVAFSFLWMMKVAKAKAMEKSEVLEVSYLFILIPLFSPLGWYYNYLYSILAVILLLNCIKRFRSFLKYVLIANFIIIGGTLRETLGKELFHFYTQYSLLVINYLIVLFYLFYLRVKKYS